MRGSTLIELLIALVLAGIAVAGALTSLAQAQRTWHDAERLGRMHERAQYVFGTLEPELQMAGYFGAVTPPRLGAALPAALLANCGSVILPLQPAVQVTAGGALPCPAHGGGARPQSEVLILRRASTRIAAGSDGALQLQDGGGAALRDLFVRIYYVAASADGDARTPALRVKSLTPVAGQPTFVDTEVMPGIDGLQVELLPDSTAPRSVRINLQVRPDAADIRAGETPPSLAIERRFNLRNTGS